MTPLMIIGAGHGGVQLAASLRMEGYSGPITLFDGEDALPYHRPPLSKAYMDHGDTERLHLRPKTFFSEHMIDYRSGVTIIAVDRTRQEVTTQSGERIAYAHLVLATGSTPYRPPIPGATLSGLSSLRNLNEAVELRAKLEGGKKAVVLGAGFIGLEFAAMARLKGLDVTVLEAAPRVLARVVSADMSQKIEAEHTRAGVEFRLDTGVARIVADNNGMAKAVVMHNGEQLNADIILMATGARANTALAEAAGLAVSNGITVDASFATSDPAISALGDCASFPDPFGNGHIRLESIQAANDHARCLAARLTGKMQPYEALAWFWSDQGEMKLQIAGFDPRQNLLPTEVYATPLGDRRFIVCRFEQDRLKAVETLNAPAQHMAARKLLTADTLPGMRDVLAANGDLQSLIGTRATG
jgi:3-phenylpropionate/trans-cinnamate dioxygenase ferredoxin reductase component